MPGEMPPARRRVLEGIMRRDGVPEDEFDAAIARYLKGLETIMVPSDAELRAMEACRAAAEDPSADTEPEIDPENPPLRPDVKLVPFREGFRARVEAMQAARARREQQSRDDDEPDADRRGPDGAAG